MISESQAYLLIKCRRDSSPIGLDKRSLKACLKKGLIAPYSKPSTYGLYYTVTSSGLAAIAEYGSAGKTAYGIKIKIEKFGIEN